MIRVDFHPQWFEQFISDKGMTFSWQQFMDCPCYDPTTSRAVPDCSLCDGRGRFYTDPQTIKGLIGHSSKDLNSQTPIGLLEPGEAYLTVSHTNFLALFDKLTHQDSTVIGTEVLSHSDKDGDSLKYPPIGNVIAAISQSQATNASSLVNLVQNKDYTVDAAGNLTWISNRKPADKQAISFRYLMRPVWIVISTLNYIRDTHVLFGNPADVFTNMPNRYIVRLEFFGDSARLK